MCPMEDPDTDKLALDDSTLHAGLDLQLLLIRSQPTTGPCDSAWRPSLPACPPLSQVFDDHWIFKRGINSNDPLFLVRKHG